MESEVDKLTKTFAELQVDQCAASEQHEHGLCELGTALSSLQKAMDEKL